MVIIRLARVGTNKRPYYHMVVTDKKSARNGRIIERIGFFNPIAKGKETPTQIDMERVSYWTSKGCQLSDSAKQLIEQYSQKTAQAA